MKSEKSKTDKKRVKKLKRIESTNVLLWRNFALFTVAIIIVVSLVCYAILGNAFFAQTKKRVVAVGEEVYSVLNDEKVPDTAKEMRINDYALANGMDIFLLDESGTPVIPYGFVIPESWDSVVKNVNDNAGEWVNGKSVVYNLRAGDKSTINYVCCVSYKGEQCKVLVAFPLNTMSAAVHQMQIYLIIVALVAIVFTFFVSYFVTEKLSRPLRDTSATAKKLAAGDYSVEFTATQYSEIAELSTALNYMKDEIKKSGDFQKELLANVSHDLKTPLTMIKAYASMIQEISGDDKQKREKHLQVIIDESDRLTGLVNDVLSASKINSGLEQLNKKVFNLTEYLYGVINKFSYLSETQGYNIMVDIVPNLYTLADEEKIGQVFYNLISNAVNYTGEDKTIYVSLNYSAEENRIKFAVRDTGKGIAEDELANIWDRYYRSKDSHTRPIKGTGLGLNIVKAILESHAFNFGVTSEQNYGSTFFVDFPVA